MIRDLYEQEARTIAAKIRVANGSIKQE